MTTSHHTTPPDDERHEYEICGIRFRANPDTPPGTFEIHREDGTLERRYPLMVPLANPQHPRMSVSSPGTTRSIEIRTQRALLKRDVQAGASLAALLVADDPAIALVRCYQLVCWLPDVGEKKANRLLLGIPGHLRWGQLSESWRDYLIVRVQRLEDARRRRARS